VCFADERFAGFVRGSTNGEDAKHNVTLPMPHHFQRELGIDPLRLCRANFVRQCSRTCPKGLNPALAIQKMKLELSTGSG
jgi:hypothetical protein